MRVEKPHRRVASFGVGLPWNDLLKPLASDKIRSLGAVKAFSMNLLFNSAILVSTRGNLDSEHSFSVEQSNFSLNIALIALFWIAWTLFMRVLESWELMKNA